MGRGSVPRQGGWLLVGLIVLIAAVILALAGITFYLTEHLRTTSLRQNQTKAIYLAQAGVMRELYDFRRGVEISVGPVSITAGPPGGIAGDDIYEVDGPEADFLLVNMRGSAGFAIPNPSLCSGTRDRLEGWVLRNVLASGGVSVRIDEMRVNWSPDNGEGVMRIDINGTGSDWTAPGCCGATCNPVEAGDPINIPNQTLGADARWATNRIWFTSSAMETKDWIEVIFVMRGGSERVARFHPTVLAERSADFTLRSLGTVQRGAFPFSLWRRLRAEYRICRSDADTGANCASRADEQRREGRLIGYSELTTLSP